jgi:hypothetical protein
LHKTCTKNQRSKKQAGNCPPGAKKRLPKKVLAVEYRQFQRLITMTHTDIDTHWIQRLAEGDSSVDRDEIPSGTGNHRRWRKRGFTKLVSLKHVKDWLGIHFQ